MVGISLEEKLAADVDMWWHVSLHDGFGNMTWWIASDLEGKILKAMG